MKGKSYLATALIGVFFIALLSIVALLGIYFLNFRGSFGSHEVFAQFGDFIGGALNPILGFLTVLLLIVSVWFQRQELSNVTEELEQMRIIHRQSLNMRHYEYIIKNSLEDNSDFQYALKRFISVFDREILLEIGSGKFSAFNKGTFFDALNRSGSFSELTESIIGFDDEEITECFSELSSTTNALIEVIEMLKRLGCPQYMASPLLSECTEVIQEYFFKQSKMFQEQLEIAVEEFQLFRKLVLTYPEYPEPFIQTGVKSPL